MGNWILAIGEWSRYIGSRFVYKKTNSVLIYKWTQTDSENLNASRKLPKARCSLHNSFEIILTYVLFNLHLIHF